MSETDLLGDLPSKKFLKELNDNGNDNGNVNMYSIDCESITTDSCEKEKIQKIYTKLEKNINYLENYNNYHLSFFHKHCYDLNYWLYTEVAKEFGESGAKTNIHPVLEFLQKQWNNINRNGKPNNSDKICKPESELFKTGLFEHIKELLDYFENFDTLNKQNKTEDLQPNKHCDYIKKCVPLYFTFKKLCELMQNDMCGKYLSNNDGYDPKDLLSKLSCVQGSTYKVELDESLVKELIKTYQSDFGNLLSGFGNILPGFGSIIPGLSSIMPGLGNLFTGSLEGMFMNSVNNLIEKGFEGSNIKNLISTITYYTDTFYSENFQKYGLTSLFGLCCCCLPCCTFKRKKKRRKHLSDLDTSELMSAPLGFPSPMMPLNPYILRYQTM